MKIQKSTLLWVMYGLAFLYCTLPIGTQAIESINVRLGVGIPNNSIVSNPQTTQLAPTIELFGVGMDISLNNFINLSPFIDLSVNEVLYSRKQNAEGGGTTGSGLVHPRAFVDITNTNYTTLLAFYIGIPLLVYVSLGDFFRIGIGASPTLAFRIPLSGADRDIVGRYYTEEGRFFIPEIILNVGYSFQDVELLISGRVWFPISNLWDGDGSSFLNEFTIAVTAQLRFILFDPPTEEAEKSTLSAIR